MKLLEPQIGPLRRLAANRSLVRLIRLTGTLLTVVSTTIVLRQATLDFDLWFQSATLYAVVVAYGSFGLSFGLQGVAWCLLIGGLSETRTGWRDLEIWAYSSLMRRTPGVVWYLIERVERYRESGLGAAVTLTAAVGEWALLLIAGAVVFVVTRPEVADFVLPMECLAMGLGILLLSSVLVKRSRPPTSSPSPQIRQLGIARRVSSAWVEFALSLLLYTVCYVLGGVIVFTLVHIADAGSSLALRESINLWALTGAIAHFGSVVIPVNVGLREITLVAALLPFTTASAAITVAAMIRLLFITADIAFSIGFWQAAQWLRLRRGGDATASE